MLVPIFNEYTTNIVQILFYKIKVCNITEYNSLFKDKRELSIGYAAKNRLLNFYSLKLY